MDKNLQTSLIDAIQIMVDEAVKSTSYTSSHVGLVKKLMGFDCIVELYGNDTTCKVPEHLHTQIGVGDIVIVQDLYNNSVQKFVQSKIGAKQ
ncbi:hypothetical protein CN553_12515 [Bacillus cereus]|uniref:Uncharacterized protein n=1 Tax=Bacillus cereus TaxID=1396 RepID=A0A9X6UCM2_BACCE|nr:hypothetical protein [Bacillus cereus]PEN97853.1 hypothetical protein CN553_12515 [Bacillus cereus]